MEAEKRRFITLHMRPSSVLYSEHNKGGNITKLIRMLRQVDSFYKKTRMITGIGTYRNNNKAGMVFFNLEGHETNLNKKVQHCTNERKSICSLNN